MGVTLITNSAPFSEIGTKTLSAYLNKFGVHTKIIYLNNLFLNKLPLEEKKQILKITKDDELIGISLMTKDFILFKDLSEYLKIKCRIPVVWGGIHPSVCPEESLSCCDYVCIGEGEEPLLMLYKALIQSREIDNIPNILWKKNGKLFHPKSFFTVKGLDELPFPDYGFDNDYLFTNRQILRINSLNEKQKKKLLGKTLLFYSQRGCPFSCSYCSNNALKKISRRSSVNFYRKTTVDRIIKELSCYTSKYQFIKKVIINDDDFLARNEDEIKLFSENYKKEIKIPFWINAVPSFVTPSKINSLSKAGLCQISMGIQTGSIDILKNIYKRYLYPDEIVKSVLIIKKNRIKLKIGFDLIVDNPYEKDSDMVQTVKLLNKLPKPYDLQIHSLVFFPGTELYNKALKDRIISVNERQAYYKRYQTDIIKSYFNFVLLLNTLINLPSYINNIFISNLILNSNIFIPFRKLLAINVKTLLLFKGIKSLLSNPELLPHYLKYIKLNKLND